MALPEGAIPVDQFESAESAQAPASPLTAQAPAASAPQPGAMPQGAIPIDEFESQEEAFSTPGQQLLAGVEGAANAASLGLASEAENYLSKAGVPGISPRERALREEINPEVNTIGQGIGLIGSAISGVGAAPLLEKAGAAVAKAVVPQAAPSVGARIGSAAVKGFVENAIYQAGDENVKYALGDPNSVQTAALDIGLSGLMGSVFMGGVTGAGEGAKALWNTTAGKNTQAVLKSITDKLGGAESFRPEGMIGDPIENAMKLSGVEFTPAMKAAYSEIPFIRQQGKILLDSTTGPGLEMAAQREAAKQSLRDAAANVLGRSPEDLAALENLSENKAGAEIKDLLTDEIKNKYAPFEKSYEKLSNKFKSTIITNDIKAETTDALGKLMDNGMSAQSDQAKFLQRVVSELPEKTTLEQLRNFNIGLGQEIKGKMELWDIGKKIRGVLDNATDNTLTQVVQKEAPDLIAEHAATKAGYRELKSQIDTLNDRLSVGRYKGVKTFLSNLKDLDPEKALNRLSPKNKADVIGELTSVFPEVASKVKAFEMDKILKKAISEGTLDINKLDKQIQGLTPEMKQFLFPPEALDKLDALKTLDKHLPTKEGLSGTPKGMDGLNSLIPASATGLVTLAITHNPAIAGIVGYLTKALARDLPDAARMGLLKFLGSDKEISAPAFKAMVNWIQATMKGETLLAKGTKAVFKSGMEVLPTHLVPGSNDRERLEKQLNAISQKPDLYSKLDGDLGHYMPEHAEAAGATTANAINYLNSIRPKPQKLSPLDSDMPVTKAQKTAYDRALDIAQQPLVVLKSIKDGTLTSNDVTALQKMYPAVYQRISEKLMSEMTDHVNKGENVPYKSRLTLSLFLGQPLDSTMRPESIIASQPTAEQRAMRQQAQSDSGVANGQSRQLKQLSKLPGQYQTQDQARTAKKLQD